MGAAPGLERQQEASSAKAGCEMHTTGNDKYVGRALGTTGAMRSPTEPLPKETRAVPSEPDTGCASWNFFTCARAHAHESPVASAAVRAVKGKAAVRTNQLLKLGKLERAVLIDVDVGDQVLQARLRGLDQEEVLKDGAEFGAVDAA